MSDWLEKIHAHADGRLEGDDKTEVEALLANDPKAAAEHQWAVYIKETLRSKHVVPDHTDAWQAARERIDALNALQGDSKVESFVGRFSWSFAAAIFAVILFAGFLNWGGGQRLSDRDLAGLFATGSTTEQRVSGASEAGRILRSDMGVDLPSFEPVIQFTRIGKGTFDGRNFMRVDMVDNVGPLTMFVFQGTAGFESFEPVSGRSEFFGGQVNGNECVGWSESGVTFLVVASRSTDEMVVIADRMRG